MMPQAGMPVPMPDRARELAGTVGRRSVAYVIGTLVLAALAWLLEQLAHGNDRGAGVLAGTMLWAIGSVTFFGLNALLILGWVIDQTRSRAPMFASPVARALIGCALPVLVLMPGMAFVS